MDPRQLENHTPVHLNIEERIRIAERCRDADVVPKVENAGAVVVEPDGTRVQIMHNGIKVLAGGYYGEWMQDLITRCAGHHEPQEELVFHEVLKHVGPQATMIELGGHWSFYSIWFLSTGQQRRSVIVEPDPAYLEGGRANARLNNCTPEFIHAFAGALPSEPAPFQTETSGIASLPCVSVPFLVDSRQIAKLDILHCDCQGSEFSILESCRELFAAGRVDWVFVSTHTHHISNDPLTHQRCLALLAGAGATIVAEHDVQESFSGDGLIVAKFGELPPSWQQPRLSFNRYSHSLFRNPLYDLALKQSPLNERDVAAFLKQADPASRDRLFDACAGAGVSEYLYAEHNGARFLVNSKDQFISRGLFVSGNADIAKLEVASRLLKQQAEHSGEIDLLVDVGANIGGICIPAVLRGLARRAIAIEPQPTNCQLLRANIAINGLFEKIAVVERAAGASDDELLPMEISSDNWGDHRISNTRAPGLYGEAERTRMQVRSIRIDSLKEFEARTQCLIWMDIQGYEGFALRGAAHLLARKVPLVLEFWPYGMLRAESFAALREALAGYRGFYDLEKPERLRPMADIDALFEEMGVEGRFTDILVI